MTDKAHAMSIVNKLLEGEEPPMTKDEVLEVLSAINPARHGSNLSFVSLLNKYAENEMIRPDAKWVVKTFNSVVEMVKMQRLSQEELWSIYDEFSHFSHGH